MHRFNLTLSSEVLVLSKICFGCYYVLANLKLTSFSSEPSLVSNDILRMMNIPSCTSMLQVRGPINIRCQAMCGYHNAGCFLLYPFGFMSHVINLHEICHFESAVPGKYTLQYSTTIYPSLIDNFKNYYSIRLFTESSFEIGSDFIDTANIKYPRSTEEKERKNAFDCDKAELLSTFPKFTEHDAIDMEMLLKRPIGNLFFMIDLSTPDSLSSELAAIFDLQSLVRTVEIDLMEKCSAYTKNEHKFITKFVADMILSPQIPICQVSCPVGRLQQFIPEIIELLTV